MCTIISLMFSMCILHIFGVAMLQWNLLGREPVEILRLSAGLWFTERRALITSLQLLLRVCALAITLYPVVQCLLNPEVLLHRAESYHCLFPQLVKAISNIRNDDLLLLNFVILRLWCWMMSWTLTLLRTFDCTLKGYLTEASEQDSSP